MRRNVACTGATASGANQPAVRHVWAPYRVEHFAGWIGPRRAAVGEALSGVGRRNVERPALGGAGNTATEMLLPHRRPATYLGYTPTTRRPEAMMRTTARQSQRQMPLDLACTHIGTGRPATELCADENYSTTGRWRG